MPERGGTTTQSGIYYQNTVAALYLGRLCDSTPRPDAERVVGIRVEAPSHVDDTVVTYADGHQAYIQAKETINARQEAWKELWQDFDQQFQTSSFQRGKDRLVLHIGVVSNEVELLRESCERSYYSETYQEWRGRLTDPQGKLVDAVSQLLGEGRQDGAGLLDFISHVDVEAWPLPFVERDLTPHWMPASNELPATLLRLLRDRIGGMARVRGTFSPRSLSERLEEDGVRFTTPPGLNDLRAAVHQCSSLLRQHKATFGETGKHLTRSVTADIVAWARQAVRTQNTAVLLDQAGMGKTVVSRDVLCSLEDQGVTVLAIKADQQLSQITSYEQLSSSLHLPDTLERTVSRLAAASRVVVQIDQVDALSLSLAHDQTALNVALELVARLRNIPNVCILLSCRAFDFNSDPRLKRLEVSKQFHLTALDDTEVTGLLETVGVAYDALLPATRALLRTPLHLDLFLRAMAEQPHSYPPHQVTSLQDLYTLLWQNVVLKAESGAPPYDEREEVLRLLSNYMDQQQRTTVPQAFLGGPQHAYLGPAARWLASTGILLPSGLEWSFLHQTFFDYCYARRFVEQDARLSDVILSGSQDLFARPQVIQVLAYLRGSNHAAYLRDLSALLNSPRLRFHLRDLLLRWFGSLPDPSDQEWTLAARMLVIPYTRPLLLRAVQGNPGWFTRLSGGMMQSLLNQSDDVLDREVVPYLTSLLPAAQAEVIGLLRPYLGRTKEWDNRLAWVVSRIGHWQAPEAIDLFEQVMRKDRLLVSHRVPELDVIAREQPEAACRMICIVLDRILNAYLQKRRGEGPYPPSFLQELEVLNGSTLDEALKTVSENVPHLFLDSMLPWLEEVLRLKDESDSNEYSYGSDALSRGWHNSVYVVQHQLIQAFQGALIALARAEPESFRSLAAGLSELPYRTPQQLLVRAFTAVAETHTTEALSFLLGDSRRLNLGDHEQYEIRQLITALFPHLEEQQCEELEAAILGYKPWSYPGVMGLRWRGLTQFHLLQAVPKDSLTAKGRAVLRELARKFPEPEAQASNNPSTMRGGMVMSPIHVEQAGKMSDRAWLRAMRKYHGGVRHREFLKGGADQLSHVLTEQIKEEPLRFWKLFQATPDDLDDHYVQAFLNGFSEAEAPVEWLCGTVRRFAPQIGRNITRTIAWALEKRAAEGLPDDILDLLEGYARDASLDSGSNPDGDPDFTYLNSDRGSAFRALMRSLDQRATDGASARRWEMLEYAAADPAVSLRAGAVEELLFVFYNDRERAVTLFERLIQGLPSLLGSHRAQEFIYHGLGGFFGRLEPVIRAMMDHPAAEVQQRGVELACIAAISPVVTTTGEQTAALALAQSALSGPAPWRTGAAQIYAHNLVSSSMDHCARGLMHLLDDEDDDVLRHIPGVFSLLHAEHIFSLREFIEAFAASKAAGKGGHQFANFLWQHGALDPLWALSVVDTLLENRHTTSQHRQYESGEELIRLVVRIYTDPTQDNAVHAKALNLFDRLLARYEASGQRILTEWDRK